MSLYEGLQKERDDEEARAARIMAGGLFCLVAGIVWLGIITWLMLDVRAATQRNLVVLADPGSTGYTVSFSVFPHNMPTPQGRP